MAVKIKLKRMGKMRNPQYRIVIADARTKRDGRAIEEIGIYQPKEEPSLIRVDSERAQYWLSVGAQPTEAVTAILKVTGDWQKFKGLPGQEGTLRVAPAKVDKKTVFEAAALEAANEPVKEATTPKKKAAAEPKAEEVVAEVAADEAAPAEVVADEAAAQEVAAEVVADEDAAEDVVAEAPEAAQAVADEAVAEAAEESTEA